jgi:hypothetical protein
MPDQRHCFIVATDPADDDRQHVGQLRADDQESFRIGLRRDDLQQGDELTGTGQPVLDQAVVADLQEFLNDPVKRRTSTAAQAQNARSSSTARSRRFPVAGSSAQIFPLAGRVVTDRVRVCPAVVKVSPGRAWRAA